MNVETSYFKDTMSGYVLKAEGTWNIQEMKKNPDYKEISKKEAEEPKKVKE